MKDYLIRFLLIIGVVVVYFVIWKGVRSAFTTYVMIPQIEVAVAHCDVSLDYEVASRTAVVIYRGNEQYRFNAPAGFYLLFGIIFIVLMKGSLKFYQLILSYHLIFIIITILTFYVGLCYIPILLHLSSVGTYYFTPFFTFFVLILLFFPSAYTKYQSDLKKRQD